MSKSSTALLGAGAFSLSLAALTVTVAQPALLKAPTVFSTTTHFEGAAMAIDTATGRLVPKTLKVTQVTGTHKVDGKVDGGSDVAVYDTYGTNAVVDAAGNSSVLSQSLTTYPFNRSTGQLVGGDHGPETVTRTDTHAVKLPFDTKKQDYRWYDQSTGTVQTLHFAGTKTIKGLETYEFVYSAPATNLGPLPVVKAVPGAWVGHPEVASLPADQWAQTTQHLFINPQTGGPVSVDVAQHSWAQVTAAAPVGVGNKLDLLTVEHLRITDADVASLIADSKADGSKVALLQKLPYALGALGVLLLGAGIVLGRRRKGAQPEQPAPGARPDVSGILPAPRQEPAADPARLKG